MAGINGYRFVADRQGWLTIIHPSGFKERLHLIPHTLKNRANNFSVAANSNGLFYIATYGAGLYTYKPSTRRLEHFTATDARRLLTSNLLTCVTVDRQDNVWVGCEAVGACCIRTLPDVLASYVCPEPRQQRRVGQQHTLHTDSARRQDFGGSQVGAQLLV